jgi:hypothetical protein
MNTDNNSEILNAVCEIRDLVRLIAEPQIAARDQKLRNDLIRIVGKSVSKQRAVLLMDGSQTQTDIHLKTGVNRGHLSTLIKHLGQNALLTGSPKQPKLAISIPPNFFDNVPAK